ncbi:unannotated protein [freshwater metagenome]|uniref:Unannotated protein n=1 Tax=freshwater metagenome TaxID=449393 RepID=A0A6J7BTJ0_9ZZZZ
MAIVYKNGRLVRQTGSSTTTTTTPAATGGSGGYSPEEIQAIIGAVTSNPKGINLGKSVNPSVLTPAQQAIVGNTGPLTQAQMDIARNFQKNAAAEGAARLLALKKDEKARTAWGKKDNDNDGVPNAIDKTPNGDKPSPTGSGNQPSPTGNGSQNGNTNMATDTSTTPMKTWIANQLRMAGLPDTPSNRASLRKEYIAMETAAAKEAKDAQDEIDKQTAAANKIITDKATKDAETAATTASNKAAYDAIMKSISGYETNADTAKTDAMQRLADLYDPQVSALGTQKDEQLNFLQQVLGQAGTDINASEKDFLSRLITPSAYTDVPLLNMPQQQNALLTALQSQGADTGKVAEQSAADASINDFMKQLLARSNTQYGNAQTNYVDALRNAGMGAAKSGRDYLALEQPRLQSGINTKFADLLAGLNTNRANAESDVMGTFQKALADAAAAKLKGETDYPQTGIIPSATIAKPVGEGVDLGTGFDDGINSDLGKTPADGSTPLTYDFTGSDSNPEGLTPEKLKKLQEDLANMFSNGGFGPRGF